MDILSVNADRKLFEISSSIAQDTQTWHGWFCLKIDLTECEDTLFEDSLGLTSTIIKTHLKDLRGHAFICETKSIHILCKPPSENILNQTGLQICDLISSENGSKVTHTLYDLYTQGTQYSKEVIQAAGSLLSLPPNASESGTNTDNVSIFPIKQPSSSSRKKLLPQNTIKVLLVEDDPITRWMVRNSLKDICDFATAPTASKAYAMYTSYEPDVVFLDINLPDNNGRAVLDWIMEHDPGASVVMFSSNDSLENITECLNGGARGFVSKPFLKEDLLHYVEHSTE